MGRALKKSGDQSTRRRPGRAIGLMLVGAIAAIALSGTAMAVTDASFTYSTPQTGRLTIHPRELGPSSDEAANADFFTHTDLRSQQHACFATSVDLPQQAKITNVQTFYRSGAASELFFVGVHRVEMATGDEDFVTYHVIHDDSDTYTSATAIPPSELRVVNNNTHAYAVTVCVGPGDRFRAARITYQYTSAGD